MSDTSLPLEAGPSRDQDSSSRLSKERRRRVRHHKSRKGCFTCKQRRVKCDEVQPICGACAFRGETCSYPLLTLSTSVPSRSPRRLSSAAGPLQPLKFRHQRQSAEPPLLSQNIHLADLRLLSRFMMHTSKEMTLSATRKDVWEQVIPDMVTKKEYLMHLLLALSGEHVLYQAYMTQSTASGIDDNQSSLAACSQHELQLEYHRVIQHHQMGLEGYRQALTDISPTTAEDIFCGALLITAISFASICTRNQDRTAWLGFSQADDDQSPYIDWLHLVRGLTSIIEGHWFTLKRGRLRTMLFYLYDNDDWKAAVPAISSSQFPRLRYAPKVFHVFAQGACRALQMLRIFARTLSPSQEATMFIDGDSLSRLQQTDHHDQPTPSNGADDSSQHDHEQDECPQHDHLHTIDRLEEIYMRILYALQFSRSERDTPASLDIQNDIEDSAVMSWPCMLSARFFDSLQSSAVDHLGAAEGFSYTILAHFYLVSILFQDLWYLNSGFRSEIQKIIRLVSRLENEALSGLLKWPMAVIAESR
ncbi:Zn(II)2Cys6 transcription factor domain-containing protein, partial [Aspergillus brunneoviolaceus CBS 621.78]